MNKENLGFTFRRLRNGDVAIDRYGKRVTVLRKNVAARFLEEVNHLDCNAQQQEMARLTGNYRRGNENMAKDHPRNK